MKSATTPIAPDAESTPVPSHMGSEYMNARNWIAQTPRVKDSDETFHGSNDSDFGTEKLAGE
jgi:hypothetical protein